MELINEYSAIRTLIEDRLNTNTYNLDFKVFTNVENADVLFSEQVQNYKVIEKEFVPVIINGFFGDYIPLTNKKAVNQSTTLMLYVRQDLLEQTYDVLVNTLAPEIIGKQYILDASNAVFNMSKPNYNDSPELQNGEYYFVVAFQLYFKMGEGFIFGNSIKYYMKDPADVEYKELVPIGRQTDLTKSPESNQLINTNYVTTIIKENKKLTSLTFYYLDEPIYHTMAQEIEDDSIPQNTIYDFKVVYPTFQVEKKVLIESGSVSHPIGDFSSISVVLSKANEVIYNV